jgi:glycine/D-amino acid oxidase-like deaminating enzyme/nitrite reductase/ring-hydroxylating ferredoxin subunit
MMENQSTVTTTGSEASVWQLDISLPKFGSLKKQLDTEVCIVGGGIAGLTTAYLLACEGISVTVLESKFIGSSETGRSTAHLTNAFDDHYQVVEHLYGIAGSQAVANSHTQAIDCIEQIVNQEQMDCGFERLDGYLFITPGTSQKLLQKELAAAHHAGLNEVEWIEHMPIASLQASPCLRFPNQAQINPAKYIIQLAQAIIKKRGKIFDTTHVNKIQGGKPCLIDTSAGHQISAQHVVVATNTPINDTIAIHDKQSSNRTYVIGARIPKGSVKKALYWDTEEPYHYIRLQSGLNICQSEEWRDYDLLIVGGEDHRVGKGPASLEPYARLEQWTRERFAMVDEIPFRWSGQIQEPVDGLAFIGHDPLNTQNVYIATGDSGNGMTHGTITGLLIKDLILNKPNPWAKYYDPSRKPLKLLSLKEFAVHNLESAWEFTQYLTPGEVKTTDAIIPGTGAVIRQGLHKIAAYRDPDGKLHQYSAVCHHLKCIVAWNSMEHSWDCPCHGSRYDRFGKVINGPATQDLTPIDPIT